MKKRRKKSTAQKVTQLLLTTNVILLFSLLVAGIVFVFAKKAREVGFFPEKAPYVSEETPSEAPQATSSVEKEEQPVTSEVPAVKIPTISVEESGSTYVRLSWEGDPDATYRVRYRTGGGEWLEQEASPDGVTISGLMPASEYEIRFLYKVSEEATWAANSTAVTKASGAGDPMRAVYALLTVAGETKCVQITASEGCFGMHVWPQIAVPLYEDATLDSQKASLAGGEALRVAKDGNGWSAYLRANGHWSLFVEREDGTDGWVDADAMLVDLQDLFPVEETMYAIHCDRTNAYDSIFTIGGSGRWVDDESAQETRFAPLDASDDALSAIGYNEIPGITGHKLENYGSKSQMPVIWQLALELLQCQKTALAKGCSLLIYDGYRPSQTSRSVNQAVTQLGVLRQSHNGRNLANGFLGTNFGESNYIANQSKHNKGIAVDLSLVAYRSCTVLGSELEMQTKMHTLDFRSNMQYNNKNATLLYDIMTTGTSLVPLKGKQEWWHFELPEDVEAFPYINQYIFAGYKL